MSIRHSLLIVCWVDRWEVILPIQMPAGPIQYPILMLQNDWTRVFLISDRIISTLYGNLSTVKQVSENTNNPVPYAIAQIIKVAAMSRVTDAYGPIPYSKIGQDGKITIPYDTQEEVYNAFFKELDESIEVLTENRNAALVASAISCTVVMYRSG